MPPSLFIHFLFAFYIGALLLLQCLNRTLKVIFPGHKLIDGDASRRVVNWYGNRRLDLEGPSVYWRRMMEFSWDRFLELSCRAEDDESPSRHDRGSSNGAGVGGEDEHRGC